VTDRLTASHQATVPNVGLASIGDTEYFNVVAPAFPGATLEVTAAAANVSLLSPQVSILDSGGNMLAFAANPVAWGNNVTAVLSQVVPGRRYWIAVTGATHDDFAVGDYQLSLAFAGDPTVAASAPAPAPGPAQAPVEASPANSTAGTLAASAEAATNSSPKVTRAQATPLGTISAITVKGLTLEAAGAVNTFSFQVARAGTYIVSAPAAAITVLDGSGNPIVTGIGAVEFRSLRPRTPFFVALRATSGAAIAREILTIGAVSHRPAAAPNRLHSAPLWIHRH
jgi:hypothetical protein